MAGADRAPAEQRRQFQLDPGREAERALRPDQDMCEIERVAAGQERIEIVAADAALHFRKARFDFARLARADREQIARDAAQRRSRRQIGQVGTDGAEMRLRSVGEDRVDRQHVLARIAVAQRARAAGIVAGHAADGGARGGGDIDRKPQAVRLQGAVEIVEHDAGLDHAAASRDVELQHAVEIFRAIQDQRMIDRLPALRGAAAARQHGDALFLRDRYRAIGFLDRSGRDHADRHHLIMRGIGGIAAAGERSKRTSPVISRCEPPLQPRHQAIGQSITPIAACGF